MPDVRLWKRPWIRRTAAGSVIAAILFVAIGSATYGIGPGQFVRSAGRAAASHALEWWHSDDLEGASEIRSAYWYGSHERRIPDMAKEWGAIKRIGVITCQGPAPVSVEIPFVYAEPSQMADLRAGLGRLGLAKASGRELPSMIAVGTELGGVWDHGDDAPPSGVTRLHTIKLIEAGRSGSRFWCELAATTMVQVASSRNWIGRLVTLSRDGYTWEHAVAELWSHEHGKWFMIDTDFNVMYRSGGKPLSSFELCHDGPRLQAAGKLEQVPLGAAKPSLPRVDLLPYFRYVFIDLRSDWSARRLPRGSPAGGDRSTWWTARKGADDIVTARTRVDDKSVFDWPVDVAWILPESVSKDRVRVRVGAYGPNCRNTEVRVFDGDWKRMSDPVLEIPWREGALKIEARVRVGNEDGPVSVVSIQLR